MASIYGLQVSVLNHCLRQLALLQYVIWRTPPIPGSVTLDYLRDWDWNNCWVTDLGATWPVEMTLARFSFVESQPFQQ